MRDEPSNETVRVHVFEHPYYDRLDYELGMLLDVLPSAPEALFILNFLDPRAKASRQVVLTYRPARRRLKRLDQRIAPGPRGDCRLEVWNDVGPQELRELREVVFLEKTRPATLQPEVFLGALESLLERGEP